jgi:hypothetical protein
MANNQKSSIDADQGAALAALLQNNGSNPVADRVLALLEQDLAERMAEKKEQKDQVLNFQKARRAALIEERARIEAEQNACLHVKPNGQSNLCGQKDGYGHYHFVCGYCSKEFNETNIPAHLKVPGHMVGGPI